MAKRTERRYCITNESLNRLHVVNDKGSEWFTIAEARAMVKEVLRNRDYRLLIWKQVYP